MIVIKKKSLLELTLETCVLHFQDIFLETNVGLALKTNIVVPPYLFERILATSKDLGWYISTDHLQICLKYRDALNWQNIDLRYLAFHQISFGIQELNDIASSTIPLEQLAFTTNTVTPEMMMQISTFASTLEHLDIHYASLNFTPWLKTTENINMIKFPKLKYLSLVLDVVSLSILDMIDISSFSDSIRVLKLTDLHVESDAMDRFTSKLVTILRSCKNLVTLSLENCNFFFSDEIFDSIRSLKNLRNLSLQGVNLSYNMKTNIVTEVSLAKFVLDLPNLKSLEISAIGIQWKDFECLQQVNLDYFGHYECNEVPTTTINAKEIGMDIDLNTISNFLHNDRVPYDAICTIMYNVNELIEPDDRQTWDRLERGLLRCLELRPYCDMLFQFIPIIIKEAGSCFQNNFLQKVERTFNSTRV